MEQYIEPYQYFFIKRETEQLLNVYHSVNDPKTVETVQTLAKENIFEILLQEEEAKNAIEPFLNQMMDSRLKKEQADAMLAELKTRVVPFNQPTKVQVEKIFRKVKKLKHPDWQIMDLKEHTYIGWNDPGSQKKYILYYQDDQLKGVHGTLSPTILKGICAICQKTSQVSMFLSTTKSGSDGTYTKKGNYICHDSEQCNRQLVKLASFYEFTEIVKKEK
ncbi:hypothetical protein A5844_000734 [Enterococcus sp. 10A9_DIV0425]|uniref:Fibronectin-binding protein n=1 Tax=Candidatus Enterococcus wittei TaxID=1987383 RepID=A0A2C9XQS5_9ENTE|nr:FusB/FusC family EF-G-binding protein [Enterococcus sp. 10A9_DIV0425]OTP12501.1 hypothetical protein A5844_000734 [Enterococcus sp. 10A9_DIV0425]THE09542.1 elongation factor G-binding protein [Enterococcus hirae]